MQRYNAHSLNDRAGTGPERTARLEAMLREERAALTTARPASGAHSVATANVETLEAAIEQSRRNDAARARHEADIAAAKQAETAQQEARRAARVEAEAAAIRQTYRASNPGASDAEIDAAIPALVAEHRAQRMHDATERTRTAYRSLI